MAAGTGQARRASKQQMDPSLVPSAGQEGRREVSHAAWAAGAVAGLLGALLMELGAVALFGANGRGGWWLSKLVAAAFLGRTALPGGRAADLLGLGLHFGVGVVLGVIYGAMVPRRPARADIIALPLLYSVSVFVIMTYFVLSWADPVMFARVGKGWFLGLHVLFGAALYLTVPLRDALARGPRPGRPAAPWPGADDRPAPAAARG